MLMSKIAKIIVTLGLIVLWFILSMLMIVVRQESGADGPGYMGVILLVGVIAGIRAVWKYKPEQSSKSLEPKDDKFKLDKS